MRTTPSQQWRPRQGESLVLRLEELEPLGEAIATVRGERVAVFGGIPGELVEVEVLPTRRDSLAARVTLVMEPSPFRVSPPCPYFGPCTGCQWQHIDPAHQRELKRQRVEAELQRWLPSASVSVSPTLPSPQLWGYRNHARFTVGPRGRLGFVERQTRRFVDIDRCLIMHPRINTLLGQLQGRCRETTQVAARVGVNTESYLVQPALKEPAVPIATGQPSYEESLHGRRFTIAASSFFQVNVPQAERLIDLVREGLGLTGHEILLDAYAGVGTFAVLLAPSVKKVIAIEESASALKDARLNARDVPNVEFRQGKAEEVLLTLDTTPDAAVVDPPRAGCHPATLEALRRLAPRRVAYVSCDPATLGRDLAVLCDGAYRLEKVQPVEMFPHTYHVECVAILSLEQARVEGGGPVVLASASPRRRDILRDLGIAFEVVRPGLEEPPPETGVTPGNYAEALATAKARHVAHDRTKGVVIAADTVVVDGDRVLGKPRGPAEAEAMLRRLRGRAHRVVTGLAVINAASGAVASTAQASGVTMRPYSDRELQNYVTSGGSIDKAGAYAVQDPRFRPAERVAGCYLNVVGLPACTLVDLMAQVGARVVPRRGWQPPEQCQACPLRQREVMP